MPEAEALELPPYLVLLRVGFALPAALLRQRCALTAPFHPYLGVAAGAVCFLWHFPSNGPPKQSLDGAPSRTLSGTLLCGVRTFLPSCDERPSGPAANNFIVTVVGRQSLVVRRWSLALRSLPLGSLMFGDPEKLESDLQCQRPSDYYERPTTNDGACSVR